MGHVACIEVDFGNHKQFRGNINVLRQGTNLCAETLHLINESMLWYWTVGLTITIDTPALGMYMIAGTE